ncbi:MAG: glycerophosphodiester phosphodiesterase family protein [Pseudomonadota bacterium]
MLRLIALSLAVATFAPSAFADGHSTTPVQLGPRPFALVDQMADGELKEKLSACMDGPFKKSDWSIGHRGAPLQFPEHTRESYVAGARMGAGILECDVTFTKDKQLVCRHAQNDLHTTTNILATPLAAQCTVPFTPASDDNPASAECRASDITLVEFRTLTGKMDGADRSATDVTSYLDGTANWRTNLYANRGTLLTHAESIDLFKSLGVKFMPELKATSVDMPYEGYTQTMYAQQMIDDYKAAGVEPSDVFAQSFNLDDVLYWIKNEPEFGKQAVYLDGSFRIDGWSASDASTWQHTMADLKAMGVNTIAPPMWVLITLEDGKIVPSLYAKRAKEAGLEIVTWTTERSGPLAGGGGWYYQTIAPAIKNDGDVFTVMHALNTQVGIKGLFSDWPATTTFYANCFGLK